MKITILILILLIITVPAMAQDDAPYLYYYDPNESAFVIERADGTDRHLVAQGVMPGEVHSVAGPGWSPSGQWLAWQKIMGSVQQLNATFVPYAVNINNGHPLTQLDAFQESIVLDWHPSRDWLLAIGLADSTEDAFGRQIFRIALIDAATDTTIAAYNSESFPRSLVTNHQWQSDGIIVIRTNADSPVFWQFNQDGVAQFERQATTYSISPAGHLVYNVGSGGLAVENLNTRQTVPLEGDFTSLDIVEWSGSRALIADGGLWLLDASSSTITPIADEIQLPFGYHFGAGFMQPENIEGMWSPDGKHFAYMTPDGELLVSDGLTSNLVIDDIWTWRWIDTATILVGLNDGPNTIFVQVSIDGDHQSDTIFYQRRMGWYSPDESRAAGFDNPGPWIIDFATNELLQLPRSESIDPTADYSGEILWHESSEWLIIKETPFVSMMGDDPALNAVIRADGDMRRQLPNCFVLCVEWLPEQVNIQNLTESD